MPSPPPPGLCDDDNRMQTLEEGPDPLARLHARSDWQIFRKVRERAFVTEATGPGGRPRPEGVLMFNVLVRQRDDTLSEEQTDRATGLRPLSSTRPGWNRKRWRSGGRRRERTFRRETRVLCRRTGRPN